jgi:putative nucleotidyltransferase with HDIG domain
MNREDGLILLKEYIQKEHLIKHMLSVEACMRAMAKSQNENEDDFGLAGLLHDIDYELTNDKPEKHGQIGADILEKHEVSQEIIQAIKAHSHLSGEPRKTTMAKMLYAVDPLSGLLIACALMTPDKKLASINTSFVLKRFKEKRFAAGANRDQIKTCEEHGITLDQFIEISIGAMKGISEELGL